MADNQTGNLETKIQFSQKNSSNGSDSENTLDGLLEIVTDVNKRLQNVDAVNRKMQQQKVGMSKELQNQKEQLSVMFQENCSLKEKVARLDIDKRSSLKELCDMRKENEKLNRLLNDAGERRRRNDDSVHSSLGSGRDSLRSAARSHNSVVDSDRISKPSKNDETITNSGGNSGSSLLSDDDAVDELIIQKINISLKNLTDLKQDLSYMNYSLKYILYFVHNSKLKGRCTRPSSSYLVARGGGEPDSLEDPLPPSSNKKWPPTKMEIDGKRTFDRMKSANFSDNHAGEEILESFFKRRQLPWPSQSFSDVAIQDRPFYDRGISTEAVASSLPSSSLLSPDSLSSFQITCESEGASILLNEDRVCPICQVVFPESIPQKEFEQHAENHFAFDEYELIN